MAEENKEMVCRRFFLTIISAENLPNVREVFETRAYAEISIGTGNDKIKFRTDPDMENGLNPAWNHAIEYEMAESGVLYYGLTLVIKVYCERTLGDRYIGEVHTTMKDLFDQARSKGGSETLSMPIIKGGNEETGGTLKFSYSFGEQFTVKKSDFLKKAIRLGGLIMEIVKEAAPVAQAIVSAVNSP